MRFNNNKIDKSISAQVTVAIRRASITSYTRTWCTSFMKLQTKSKVDVLRNIICQLFSTAFVEHWAMGVCVRLTAPVSVSVCPWNIHFITYAKVSRVINGINAIRMQQAVRDMLVFSRVRLSGPSPSRHRIGHSLRCNFVSRCAALALGVCVRERA